MTPSRAMTTLLSAVLVSTLAAGCSSEHTDPQRQAGGTTTSGRPSQGGADGLAGPPITAQSLLTAPVPPACGHPAGRLVHGQLPGIPSTHGRVQLGWIDRPTSQPDLLAMGDLDGDRQQDAAAVITCDAGGVPWPDVIAFYTKGPALLGSVDLRNLHLRGVESGENASVQTLRYHHGAVTARWSTQQDDDPAAFPSLDYQVDLRWNGRKINPTSPNGTTERPTVHRFLTALKQDDVEAASALAAPGVADLTAQQLRTHSDAYGAPVTCYGGSYSFPSDTAALLANAGIESFERLCLLPTTINGAHDVVLELHKTGFAKWQVAAVQTL